MPDAPAPLVSIGLPIYRDRPEGLRRALESMLAQSHTHWELHISDNASPYPAISEIGRAYAAQDPRITYHRQPENVGLDNFKLLASLARQGEFFMWMADDDCWDPDFLRHGLELLAARPTAGLAIPTVTAQNTQGEVIRELGDFSRYTHGSSQLLNTLRYTLEAEVRGKANLLCGLYRRGPLMEALQHWGPRQMERPFGDIVFLTALQARFPVVGSPRPLLRKGMPTEAAVHKVKTPSYQTFTFSQWADYTWRLIKVMPTPLGKATMAATMAMRLLHKLLIALPLRVLNKLISR